MTKNAHTNFDNCARSARSEASTHRAQGGKIPSGEAASPCGLIGGESFIKVDWFTVTFSPVYNGLRLTGIDKSELDLNANLNVNQVIQPRIVGCIDEHGQFAFEKEFQYDFQTHIEQKIYAKNRTGWYGFEYGVEFFVLLDDGKEHPIANLDFGGIHQKNRARFDLSGSGCALVKDWQLFQDWAGLFIDYTITRVDLAADFLNGEYTVIDAVNWYTLGLFNSGGNNPDHQTTGDWASPYYDYSLAPTRTGTRKRRTPDKDAKATGRTFYVGKRKNGKMLRVYEKGRQLGDKSSDWTRWEVEIRNIDRTIPIEVLTSPDNYFSGAYKSLSEIVQAAAQKIPTEQKTVEISIGKLAHHASESYGKLINVLTLFMSPEEILDGIKRAGMPARLDKSSMSSNFLQNVAALTLKPKELP